MKAIDSAKTRFAEMRRRHPLLDRAVRTQEHYSETNGSQMAGAVTFFGFLSVFPILALAFFVIGYVAKIYPNAKTDLGNAIDSVLPGLIGNAQGQIQLSTFQDNASTVGLIGLLGVLLAGLGWIASLQTALATTFEIPRAEQPPLVVGKLRDLATMCVLGVVMVASVAVTGAVRGLSGRILDAIGLGAGSNWLLWLVAVALGVAASSVLFFAMFGLLERPDLPSRFLWQGAFLGAIGFELLKNLAVYLLGSAKGQPAFQVFGISLILLIWINYFSKVTLYAASWAYAGPRPAAGRHPASVVTSPRPYDVTRRGAAEVGQQQPIARAFGAGVVVTLAGVLGWKLLGRK